MPSSARQSLITPAKSIIGTAPNFVLRKSTKQSTKMAIMSQFVCAKLMTASLPQNAVIKMETPAEPMRATVAGRRVLRMLLRPVALRYFK